jgi:hypothetical protein
MGRGLGPLVFPHRSRPSFRPTSSKGTGGHLISRKRQRRWSLWQSLLNWRDRYYADDLPGKQVINLAIQIENEPL